MANRQLAPEIISLERSQGRSLEEIQQKYPGYDVPGAQQPGQPDMPTPPGSPEGPTKPVVVGRPRPETKTTQEPEARTFTPRDKQQVDYETGRIYDVSGKKPVDVTPEPKRTTLSEKGKSVIKIPKKEEDGKTATQKMAGFSVSDKATGRKIPHEESEQIFKEALKETAQTTGRVAVGMIPVVGTVAFWKEMSPTWRAVSIAGDALFFAAPFLPRIAIGLKNIGNVKGAARVNKIISDSETTIAGAVEATSKDLLPSVRNLQKAQTTYAQNLLNAEDLKNTLKSPLGEVRPEVERNLQEVLETLPKNKQALETATQKYVDAVKALDKKGLLKKGAGFDDPAAAKQLDELPKSLPRATEKLVDDTVNPRTLKAIQSDLARAQEALQNARQKWPTEPSKWSDLTGEVSKFEAELLVRETGDISKLQSTVTDLRKLITELETASKTYKGTPYENDIIRTLKQARLSEQNTAKQLDSALKSLEVQYGRGGFLGRGKTPVTSPKLKPLVGGSGSKATSAVVTPMVSVTGKGLSIIASTIKKPGTRSSPVIEPGDSPVIEPGRKDTPGTKEPVPAEDVQTTFTTDVSPSESDDVSENVRISPSITPKNVPETGGASKIKPVPETQPKITPSTSTPVLPKIGFPQPPEAPPKKLLPPFDITSDKISPDISASELKGATTWKQGFGWWTVLQDGRTFFTKNKPAGVTVAGSKPKDTVQPLPGKKTLSLVADMGNQDVIIRGGGKKPVIKFFSDRKGRTSQPVKLGKTKGFRSQKYGRIYRTRVNGNILYSRNPLRR